MNTLAPKSRSTVAPRNATTAPTRKLSSATIGTASRPVCSMWKNSEVTRQRRGWGNTRTSVTSMSPMKPSSAIASFQSVSTAAPVRASSTTIPGGRGGGLATACVSALATASTSARRPASRPTIPSRALPARSSRSSAPAVSRRLTPLASICAPACRLRFASSTRRPNAGADASVQSPAATMRPVASRSKVPGAVMDEG